MRIEPWLTIVPFLACIALPGLLGLTGAATAFDERLEMRRQAEFPALECRVVAGIPIPTRAALAKYPKQLERSLVDRLVGRKEAIGLQRAIRSWGFVPASEELAGKHPQGNQTVLVGKRDWLFYRGDDEIVSFRGLKPFSDNDLRNWTRLLEAERDWLAAQGIDYVFMIAPNKSTIHFELLPDGIVAGRRGSRTDQLIEHLRQHSTLRILDVRGALLAEKTRHLVYLPDDTHWNELGARVGCEELVKALGLPTDRCRREAFDIVHRPCPSGDLQALLGSNLPQTAPYLVPRYAPSVPAVGPARLWDAKGHDRRRAEPAGLPTVVVFHDSYFDAMAAWFCESFDRVRYVRSDALIPATVREVRPRYVVRELVERKLNRLEPTLPDFGSDDPVPATPPRLAAGSAAEGARK